MYLHPHTFELVFVLVAVFLLVSLGFLLMTLLGGRRSAEPRRKPANIRF